jgi:hypothetical protein
VSRLISRLTLAIWALATVPAAPAEDNETAAAPTITIWYGSAQTFGARGVPQRRANILGNVTDTAGIDSLYYRLNGGARILLSRGPDTRRLSRTGDFNIDIRFADLSQGLNTVQVTAKNLTGQTTTTTVTLTASSPVLWPIPYTVAWSGAGTLQDSAQVVDGKWAIGAGGITPLERGYDRLVSIGDTTWTDYEVSAKFAVQHIDSTATAFDEINAGPGLGFLLRWNGHTTTPPFFPPITQPLTGYLPLGAIGWYHWRNGFGSGQQNRWELIGNNNLELKDFNSTQALVYGIPYVFKMQVQTIAGVGGVYRFKVWEAAQVEPVGWMLTGQEDLTGPQHGSLLLIAHHVNVTIGPVTVTPVSPDNAPPVLSNISSEPGATAATIRWATDEPASSMVLYGLTPALGDTAWGQETGVLQHEVNLTGLVPSTNYRFKVMSSDNFGNTATSGNSLFKTTSPPVASTTLSDDFRDSSLNQTIWTFVNPAPGDALLSMTGQAAAITVPSGTSHDLWTNGYQSPRIMQPANDADVDITVRFNSGLAGTSASFQTQGLVFEADGQNVMRFDFTTGFNDSTRIFAAVFQNGFASPVVKVSRNITAYNHAPLFLRVRRESHVWTEMYSPDGVQWTVAAVFYHALSLSHVGVFAANAGSSPPQLVSLIDELNAARPSVPRLAGPPDNASGVAMPVLLTWEPGLQSTSYHVQVAADSQFAVLMHNDSSIASLSYPVDGLQPSTKYYWRIRGRNASGSGLFSVGRSFTTASAIPTAPVLLLPADGAVGQPVPPSLTWSSIPSATWYHLQVAADSLFSSIVVLDSTLTDTTRVVGTLGYATSYHWRVRAQNSAGIGPYSTPRRFTTAIAPPGPVTLLGPSNHATGVQVSNLVFSWRDPGTATGYRFLLATDSSFASGIIKDDTTVVDTFRNVSGLAASTRHFWSIVPRNAGGAGPQSAVWDFTTGAVLGAGETDPLPGSFALHQNFPNPFNPSTEIRYDLAAPVVVTLTLHDLLGRVVQTLVSGSQSAGRYLVRWDGKDENGRSVASGVYLYRLHAGSFVQTRRLVLLR